MVSYYSMFRFVFIKIKSVGIKDPLDCLLLFRNPMGTFWSRKCYFTQGIFQSVGNLRCWKNGGKQSPLIVCPQSWYQATTRKQVVQVWPICPTSQYNFVRIPFPGHNILFSAHCWFLHTKITFPPPFTKWLLSEQTRAIIWETLYFFTMSSSSCERHTATVLQRGSRQDEVSPG